MRSGCPASRPAAGHRPPGADTPSGPTSPRVHPPPAAATRVSDRGRILHYVTYLDRLATQATGNGFTPTLGYGLARPHQLPAAAWVQARAFTRYDPAVGRHPQLRVWWAVLRWPVSLIILSWRRARRALFVVPTRGRPEAIRPVAPPISYRRVTALFLLVGGLVLMPLLLLAAHDGPVPVVDPIAVTLVRLVAPVLPVATALAGIVGLTVAASLLTHLGLGLSNPAARTKAPPLPGAVLELSGLAAWPGEPAAGSACSTRCSPTWTSRCPTAPRCCSLPPTMGCVRSTRSAASPTSVSDGG